MEAAYRVLARMYTTATPEQVERKVNDPANRIVFGVDPCRVLAERSSRDRSTKHRDFQLDHVLATTWFHVLDSSEPSCIEYVFSTCTAFVGPSTKPRSRRGTQVVACGMQAFQQLCGFNTLMYYSASLFQEIGFNQPTAVGLIISGTNFVFTLVALK